MNTNDSKSMLAFNPAELPELPIVDIVSFANTRVKSLAELPHASIQMVDVKTAQRHDVFVRFDNNRWDHRTHDPMKLGVMFDGWLEKLNVEVNRPGAEQAYDFVLNYQGYQQPPQWSPTPGSRWDQPRRFGEQPALGRGFDASGMRSFWDLRNDQQPPGMFGSPQQHRLYEEQNNPRIMARRMAAQSLLTQLTEQTGQHASPRLNVSWNTNVAGENQLYIQGTIGGGVGVTLRREAISDVVDDRGNVYVTDVSGRSETTYGRKPTCVAGTVSIGGGKPYNFAFYHEVLGDRLRESVGNSVLRDAFQQAWTKFSNTCGLELKHLELIFNND